MGAALDLLPRMGCLEWLTVLGSSSFFMRHGPVLFGVPLFLLLRDLYRANTRGSGNNRVRHVNYWETLERRSGRTSSRDGSGARERTCRGCPHH
jgi:hypothetical protein